MGSGMQQLLDPPSHCSELIQSVCVILGMVMTQLVIHQIPKRNQEVSACQGYAQRGPRESEVILNGRSGHRRRLVNDRLRAATPRF